MKHIKSLDSLRGLAAISVYLGHMWLINIPWYLSLKPWFFFTAGGEAVFLFFVLSGFVLTAAYAKDTNFSYFKYAIKRFLRIYPAYYLALAIAIISFILIKPAPITEYSNWLNSQFPRIILHPDNIIDALLLITKPYSNFDCVVWTLTYEVIISIVLLPLLWKFPKTSPLVIASSFIFLYYDEQYPMLMMSCFYTLFFYMGVLTYRFRDKLSFLAQLRFLPIYLFLYAILYFMFGSQLVFHESLRNITSGLGAVGFILLALHHPKVQQILENKILLFYGKISYSFYLLHMPLTFILLYTLRDYVPLNIIRGLIFVIATICAYLSYNYVEKPFISLSKKITNLF